MNKEKHAPHSSRRHAVALEYSSAEDLPRVVASGANSLADQIVELANRLGIPVTKNEELTELLSRVDPGQEVGPETFQLIAEVVSFLYHTDNEWQKEHQFLKPILDPAQLLTRR